ncbi:MAG TPA: hypothetical protein PK677_17065, partial [Acidiphilium sp.]|nr:hypothetical protein [Acidiphilium sp.]
NAMMGQNSIEIRSMTLQKRFESDSKTFIRNEALLGTLTGGECVTAFLIGAKRSAFDLFLSIIIMRFSWSVHWHERLGSMGRGVALRASTTC